MHLPTFATLSLLALLSTPSLACKCFVNNRQDNSRTESCCRQLNGVFRDGNDCAANSISERLSQFRSCCGGQSDCDFPRLAEEEKEEEEDQVFPVTTVVVV
ncbi:hypothetical protein BDW72DRAFT_197197 [Aspergillus terricola var. indicus]